MFSRSPSIMVLLRTSFCTNESRKASWWPPELEVFKTQVVYKIKTTEAVTDVIIVMTRKCDDKSVDANRCITLRYEALP